MTKSKIGASQLLSLLICSRVITTLTFTLGTITNEFINSYWLGALIAIPVVGIAALPVWFLFKATDGSIIDGAYYLSKPSGLVVSVLYSLYFLIIALSSIMRFNTFVISTSNFEITPTIFVVLIIPVFYAALKGIEPIARFTLPIALIGIGTIIFIIILLIPRIDETNIISPFFGGAKTVFTDTYFSSTNFVEIAIAGMLLPRVKKSSGKSIIIFIIASCVIVSLITFIMISVLGNYSIIQIFPFYSLSSIAESGILRRMDAIQTAVWLVFVFVKASTCLYLSTECLNNLFPSSFRIPILIIFSAAIVVISYFTDSQFYNLNTVYNMSVRSILTIVFSAVIPLILLVSVLVKKAFFKCGPEEKAAVLNI